MLFPRREKGEGQFSWYADGSCCNSVRVDKNGVGLYKLWQQQLRQFLNVGIEVAQAVSTTYSSPQALVQVREKEREREIISIVTMVVHLASFRLNFFSTE